MTPSRSFRARITWVLLTLLGLTVGLVYVATQVATGDAVKRQAEEQLQVGAKVFLRQLDVRNRQLSDALQVLASDFGFKDAMSSGDVPTIRSALANYGARVEANGVLLLGLDGRVVAAVGDAFKEGEPFPYLDLLVAKEGQAEEPAVIPAHDGPSLLVGALVRVPLPIGYVVMGFPLDDRLIQEFRALTHLDVSVVALEDGKVTGSSTTLDADQFQAWLDTTHVDSISEESELRGEHFIESRLVLADRGKRQVIVSLQRSVDAAMASFHALKTRILWIAIVAFAGSLFIALLLGRSVSRPLSQLADAAERIGEGDYQAPIDIERRDELGTLARSLQHMQRGIAERERQLAHTALHDPLTGLPNRALIQERLANAIAAVRPTALLYLGVANFRALRERFVPAESDELLRQLGSRVGQFSQRGNRPARVLGDEFLLLLDQCDQERAVALAVELLQSLKPPIFVGSHEAFLECRVGIAIYPADGSGVDELINRAAIAMHDATNQPGRLMLYEQGRDASHLRQVALIRDLRHAAERCELLLHYQPKVSLDGTPVAGRAEALLRWQHPQFGMVSPGEFIPLAERTGNISRLTHWVIEEVMRQVAEWAGRGLHVEVSLNISSDDLLDVHLPSRVEALLTRYGVPPTQLQFEITESSFLRDPELGLSILHALRGLGITFSVDDFGTGYSSLTQLRRMPVQELKIDQSFIRELDESSGDAVIVKSTIDMSHSLGLSVVAEGVEYARSLKLLQRWGCDVVQGYLISRPLPAADFEAWLVRSPQILVEAFS
ncbi:putative bifunctional diguanylate cyclase/phosphodiesterase [Pseudomonas matsuisoli]|uniref:GGDEF domain-containing protein n=1 Tax=Pseudomonas matsuisoli TaxID=1515666 RepID=A0A917URW8_9PSED|nr:EAL domain-containing protein [Pseudomonas matsuisoli]GGJ80637.1 GGDEF domain-containing protein [Pseudomonas matsuisoli]